MSKRIRPVLLDEIQAVLDCADATMALCNLSKPGDRALAVQAALDKAGLKVVRKPAGSRVQG